jgi:alanine dehydrogenase
MTRLLSRSDVAGVLQMSEAIEIMEGAFADLAGGAAVMPQRTPIPVPEQAGLALFMPAYLKGLGALGAKTVTVYKDNPARHQAPTIMGTVLLLDEQTGAPLAVMDGGFLTAIRTGAVSGLATRLLARNDAHVHTLFGTGGMARAQAWAVDCVREIHRLVLYSIDPIEERKEFAASLGAAIRCPIVQADDPRQAVAEADVVTLITSSQDPVVEGSWFRPGTHINAIGAHAPHTRELDAATLSRSKVVCDLVEACKAEAGDFLIPAESGEWSWDRVHGSLGDVLIGKLPGRESDEEITLFKSVGLAIQDISTAQHVFARASEMGVGQEFAFGE